MGVVCVGIFKDMVICKGIFVMWLDYLDCSRKVIVLNFFMGVVCVGIFKDMVMCKGIFVMWLDYLDSSRKIIVFKIVSDITGPVIVR
jgi:hypothetical protein